MSLFTVGRYFYVVIKKKNERKSRKWIELKSNSKQKGAHSARNQEKHMMKGSLKIYSLRLSQGSLVAFAKKKRSHESRNSYHKKGNRNKTTD